MSLVTVSPLSVFDLSPLVFLGACPDGFCLAARILDRVAAEEKEIVGLVRTPEGNGVGVRRLGGSGEAWTIIDHGSRLIRSSRWDDVDLVVVLQEGESLSIGYDLELKHHCLQGGLSQRMPLLTAS